MRLHPPVILGYHGIGEVEPAHDPVRLYVTPAALRRQVRALARRGYEFVAMAEYAARLHAGEPLERTAALTFDDGTADHASVLPALLDELGVPGTVYVCPGLLGERYPWVAAAAGVRFMNGDELLACARHPRIEIGAHTNTHVELDRADHATALREMAGCRDVLEELVGAPVLSFCYPRCHYSAAAPAAAREAGYTSAVTCGDRGTTEDPFELRRESLHTPDGPLTFALKSRGLYYGIRDLPPARLARHLTRPYRHRRERAPTGAEP